MDGRAGAGGPPPPPSLEGPLGGIAMAKKDSNKEQDTPEPKKSTGKREDENPDFKFLVRISTPT